MLSGRIGWVHWPNCGTKARGDRAGKAGEVLHENYGGLLVSRYRSRQAEGGVGAIEPRRKARVIGVRFPTVRSVWAACLSRTGWFLLRTTPLDRALRCYPTVFIDLKTSTIRLRLLTAYPSCRVVIVRIVLRQPSQLGLLAFAPTCRLWRPASPFWLPASPVHPPRVHFGSLLISIHASFSNAFLYASSRLGSACRR